MNRGNLKGGLNKGMNRRGFVKGMAAAALAGGGLGAGWGGRVMGAEPSGGRRPRVAMLVTEVRRHSHAQHFVDRLLEGYGWEGRHHRPAMELAGLHVAQWPEGDLAADRIRRHGVRTFPTVGETLTLGGGKLAVDAVMIIGEHGAYPRNERGQWLYPRFRWFKEIVKVFEASGRSVPVFNDKHLATRWEECVEMVSDAKRLGFPLLAGSSLPVTWRIPDVEIPVGEALVESVSVCYGGVDSYDFHGLETAQCMSERRAGGEKGIRRVQALRGDHVWDWVARREGTRRLLFEALKRSHTLRPLPGYTVPVLSLDWFRQVCRQPVVYSIEHVDGFRTAMFMLNGLVQDFTYAGGRRDGLVYSTQMHLPMPTRLSTQANFFNPLFRAFERTVELGRVVYPVERTLLTSGMTLAGVESLWLGQVPVETPEMRVEYSAVAESNHWRS